jgi:hypothetical protein
VEHTGLHLVKPTAWIQALNGGSEGWVIPRLGKFLFLPPLNLIMRSLRL